MEAVKTNSRKVDFSGQNIYVGLDVHHKSWNVNIYSDEFELKSFSQEPDVERLCNHLQTQYKGANYLVGYESGFCGFWIQRAFKQRGFDCRVIHAADVPTNNKEHLRKTDKVDSRKIAKGLKNGDMNFIHVPDFELELDRQMVRTRLALTRDSTRCKNRIKALLKLHGIGIPDSYSASRWSGKLLKWLMDVDFGSESGRITMRSLVGELEYIGAEKLKLEQKLKDLSGSERYKSNVKLLLSVPSIGLLTAMVLLTELGDIKRFKRFDELCSYCGLSPNCHSSGEVEQVGGMSRRGNSFVKLVLIECAWVAVRKDPALLLYYKDQLKVMKGAKAIIKVTRKLLSRIKYVLENKVEYEIGLVK